jgi:hypothetical protein
MTEQSNKSQSEESLTLPLLKKYIVNSVVGSIISGLGVGILTGYTFYLNTQNTLKNQQDRLIEISITLSEHSKSINAMTNSEGVNNNQVKNLESRIGIIETQQNDIYKLLIQVASDQKAILRK